MSVRDLAATSQLFKTAWHRMPHTIFLLQLLEQFPVHLVFTYAFKQGKWTRVWLTWSKQVQCESTLNASTSDILDNLMFFILWKQFDDSPLQDSYECKGRWRNTFDNMMCHLLFVNFLCILYRPFCFGLRWHGVTFKSSATLKIYLLKK